MRQQRSQDSSSIYRSKDQHLADSSPLSDTNSSNANVIKPGSDSPHTSGRQEHNNGTSNKSTISTATTNGIISPNKNEKPVQKVIPSRNTTSIKYQATAQNSPSNGNNQAIGELTAIVTKETSTYVKPISPVATPASITTLGYNNVSMVDKTKIGANKANGTKANRFVEFKQMLCRLCI